MEKEQCRQTMTLIDRCWLISKYKRWEREGNVRERQGKIGEREERRRNKKKRWRGQRKKCERKRTKTVGIWQGHISSSWILNTFRNTIDIDDRSDCHFIYNSKQENTFKCLITLRDQWMCVCWIVVFDVHDKSKVINLKFWLFVSIAHVCLCVCAHTNIPNKSSSTQQVVMSVCFFFISHSIEVELDRAGMNHWINSNYFPIAILHAGTFQDESCAPSTPSFSITRIYLSLLNRYRSLSSILFHSRITELNCFAMNVIKSHFKIIS